jgi:hypothetical protein
MFATTRLIQAANVTSDATTRASRAIATSISDGAAAAAAAVPPGPTTFL